MSIIIKMDSIKSAGHLKQAIAYILNEDKSVFIREIAHNEAVFVEEEDDNVRDIK